MRRRRAHQATPHLWRQPTASGIQFAMALRRILFIVVSILAILMACSGDNQEAQVSASPADGGFDDPDVADAALTPQEVCIEQADPALRDLLDRLDYVDSKRNQRACDGDFGSVVSTPCGIRYPFCGVDGKCGVCRSDEDCAQPPNHPGPICAYIGESRAWAAILLSTEKHCGTECEEDTECPENTFCDGLPGEKACAPKFPSGYLVKRIEEYEPQECAVACASSRRRCSSGDVTTVSRLGICYCVCGSRPSAACSQNEDCSGGYCNDGGFCGRAAGASCSYRDNSDDYSGYYDRIICATGRCLDSCKCQSGCEDDLDCGNAVSGRVCLKDTFQGACIDGCRGAGGNSCNYDQTCSSTDHSIGVCTSSVAGS